SPDGQTLYFMANATTLRKGKPVKLGAMQIGDDGVSNFKIYAAQFRGESFKNPIALPFNNSEYNCVHPCSAPDGNTLCFSSDMPGGYGGFDLYKVTRMNNGT